MTATQTETLALRAARYFGYHDMPRTSIRLNNSECLIVSQNHGQTLLMHYSEEYRPKGDFVRLTDRARDELLKALTSEQR